MKENIKLFAKIGGKSMAKWLLVVFTGIIITILFLIIALVSSDADGVFFDMAKKDICGFLLVVGAPVFLVLYFIAAQKIAADTIVYEIWKNKAESFIQPQVAAIVERVTGHEKVGKIASPALLRLKLLDANRNAANSKIQKRAIGYIFKRIRLDDIDFSAGDLKLSDVLSQKFSNFISDFTQPSWTFFWIVSGIQTVLFIGSLIFGK
jgi:hypothetical protein